MRDFAKGNMADLMSGSDAFSVPAIIREPQIRTLPNTCLLRNFINSSCRGCPNVSRWNANDSFRFSMSVASRDDGRIGRRLSIFEGLSNRQAEPANLDASASAKRSTNGYDLARRAHIDFVPKLNFA